MPRYQHPRVDPDADGAPGFSVSLGGATVPLDDDGTFKTDNTAAVAALARSYGTDADSIRVDEPPGTDTEALIADGVCPWCDDYEGDHVGQHASSAHPDEWDAYTADD